jgi:hypothetical protein
MLFVALVFAVVRSLATFEANIGVPPVSRAAFGERVDAVSAFFYHPNGRWRAAAIAAAPSAATDFASGEVLTQRENGLAAVRGAS